MPWPEEANRDPQVGSLISGLRSVGALQVTPSSSLVTNSTCRLPVSVVALLPDAGELKPIPAGP